MRYINSVEDKIQEQIIEMALAGYCTNRIVVVTGESHARVAWIARKNNVTIQRKQGERLTEEQGNYVLEIYDPNINSVASLARELEVRHDTVLNFLRKNNVKIVKNSLSRADRIQSFINGKNNRFSVSAEWVDQWEDLDKLRFLNRSTPKNAGEGRFVDIDTDWYMDFIVYFYNDYSFNWLYSQWLDSDEYRPLKPSLDHILPSSLGGGNSLDNLQFITQVENRAKGNIHPGEWEDIKRNLHLYF